MFIIALEAWEAVAFDYGKRHYISNTHLEVFGQSLCNWSDGHSEHSGHFGRTGFGETRTQSEHFR